jgi:hypothetical protein
VTGALARLKERLNRITDLERFYPRDPTGQFRRTHGQRPCGLEAAPQAVP